MSSDILDKVLERIAKAAYQEDLYETPEMARIHLVTGTPKLRTNETRDAVIEAIAIKALDPNENTESHFRAAFGDILVKDNPYDQAYPRKLDKIVGEAVEAVLRERLLGTKSATGLDTSVRAR